MSMSHIPAESGSFKVEISTLRSQSRAQGYLGIDNDELLDVLSQFEPFGLWRLDIDDGLTYWSDDAYLRHGMRPAEGPVDMVRAVRAYHPEDREHVMNCIEDAIRRRSGFRYVLRVSMAGAPVRVIEATGLYRLNEAGQPELIGTYRQVSKRVRSVEINS